MSTEFRQTFRTLFVGMTGTGKTHLMKQVFERLDKTRRFRRLIIVNRKPELAEYADEMYRIDSDGNAEAALAKHRRVHFFLTGIDVRPFLNRLGNVAMRYQDVLWWFDEAQDYLGTQTMPPQMFRPFTMGRSLGHNLMVGAPLIASGSGGLHTNVRIQLSHIVVFKTDDPGQKMHTEGLFPQVVPYLDKFRKVEKVGNKILPPDYAIKNRDTGDWQLVLRDRQIPTRQLEHLYAA